MIEMEGIYLRFLLKIQGCQGKLRKLHKQKKSQFPSASATQRYLVPNTNTISVILYVIKMSNLSQRMAAILVTQNAICEPLAYIGQVCVNCVGLGITFQEFQEFPARLIRKCAVTISGPLCDLHNKSLMYGIFPDDWKCARVTSFLNREGYSIYRTTNLFQSFPQSPKCSFLNNNLVSGLYTQLLLLFLKPQTVRRLISIVATQRLSQLKKGV